MFQSASIIMNESDDDDGHSFWSRRFTFGSVNLRVEELWGEGIGGKPAA